MTMAAVADTAPRCVRLQASATWQMRGAAPPIRPWSESDPKTVRAEKRNCSDGLGSASRHGHVFRMCLQFPCVYSFNLLSALQAVALRARRGAGVCEEAAKTGGGRAEGMCRRPEPAAPGWARWPPCMQMSRQAISNPGPRLGPMVARQREHGHDAKGRDSCRQRMASVARKSLERRCACVRVRASERRARDGMTLRLRRPFEQGPPPAKMRLGPTRKVGRGCSWLTLSRRAITTAIEMLKPKGGCAVHGEAGLR